MNLRARVEMWMGVWADEIHRKMKTARLISRLHPFAHLRRSFRGETACTEANMTLAGCQVKNDTQKIGK